MVQSIAKVIAVGTLVSIVLSCATATTETQDPASGQRYEFDAFVAAGDDQSLVGIQFSEVGVLFPPIIKVDRYAQLNDQAVVMIGENTNYSIGIAAVSSFIEEFGVYSESEILEAYYDWERDYQESQGMKFLADFRMFSTPNDRGIASFVYDHPVNRNEISPTTTFRSAGFAYIASPQWIVWVLTSINQQMDEDEAVSTAVQVIDGVTFVDGRITPESAFELYDRPGM